MENANHFWLAAALSIPLVLTQGHPFPYRNLILFITFIVILVTLVFQGLTLPWVIRKLKPEEKLKSISEYEQEIAIQKKIAEYSLQFLEEKYGDDLTQNEQVNILYTNLKTELSLFNPESRELDNTKTISLKNYQQTFLELLEYQRKLLNDMNRSAELDEDLIRKYLLLIDIEELKHWEKQLQKVDSKA